MEMIWACELAFYQTDETEPKQVRYNYNNPTYANNSVPDISTFNQVNGTGLPQLPDIPASDFTWDQSQVGSYDPSAAATFMSLMNGGDVSTSTAATTPAAAADENGNANSSLGASTDVLGGIMEQKKWGPQGGAPMFNTPNCMFFFIHETPITINGIEG